MNTDETRGRVAEPAPEEIKKHGDPFKPQVADAAGKQVRNGESKDVPEEAPDSPGNAKDV